tara:strand:+ start:107 stop:952 length:846 start_codon:yes stop_codon:yes gene_type:complete
MLELIVTGDTGSGNQSQKDVALSMEKLIQRNPKIESVLLVGDNIYESGCYGVDDPQFDEKFQIPYQNIHLPFYLCLGNHDYGTHVSNYSQFQIDYTTSKYNKDKKWNMPSKWYSQSYPHADIFFIDTNIDWLNEFEIKKQLRDTILSINNSNKKWKILCGHHTWRSVGGHGNADKNLEIFMKELVSKVSIDLYVCGHDHCKSIIEVPNNNNKKIATLVIGTGGKIYDEELFNLTNLEKDNSILQYFSPNLGVCYMKIDNHSLKLICYNEKLEEEYKYTIKK